MELSEIKKKMLAFKDAFGGEFLEYDQIEKASTREELKGIIKRHCNHLEGCADDAIRGVDAFEMELGL